MENLAIDDAILPLEEAFRRDWKEELSYSASLMLDRTWPSVGVLDLITFPLRGQGKLDESDDELLCGCAAYLALMASEHWRSFGAKVSLEKGRSGIFIEGSLGEHRGRVYIERDLKQLLLTTPNSLPVIGEFVRYMDPDSNYFCPYAFGLMTGFAPSGEGFLGDLDWEEHRSCYDLVVRAMASESASHYGRVYPDEPLGAELDVYLSGLVDPPMLMSESFPAAKSSEALISYLKKREIDLRQMRTLGRNLAFSPDEQIAATGFAVYCALTDELPADPWECAGLAALGELMGSRAILLRRAVVDLRTALSMQGDWILAPAFTEDEARRLEVERRAGLLPWLILSRKRIASKDRELPLTDFLFALSVIDLAAAKRIVDAIIENEPRDIEMRLQRIYLDIVSLEFDRAMHAIRALATEPESERNARFFYLRATCSINVEGPEVALADYDRAHSLCAREDDYFRIKIINDYAWANILIGDRSRALELLDAAENIFPYDMKVLLNKSYLYYLLEREDEALDVHRNVLLRLSPTDRRVCMGVAQRKMMGVG